jgi:hypothetical protein
MSAAQGLVLCVISPFLETLGKLSKSRLFLPSARHVAFLNGFLPLATTFSCYSRRAPRPPSYRDVPAFPPSPSHPSLPEACMCAARRRLHPPQLGKALTTRGSAASNMQRRVL